ncbi:hypothetical protein OLS45_07935, partial [Campylobacter jejuni]|nr:hypothetical protein [Campylobacter jejuni]
LAGGIGLDNIHKAVKTGAKILDLNSKLEDEKGLKDINKIKQILKELKNEKSILWGFGGQFLPESAMFALNELESAFLKFS